MQGKLAYPTYSRALPSWSPMPIEEYCVMDAIGNVKPAREVCRLDLAIWNLIYVFSDRADPESDDVPVVLCELPEPAAQRILSAPAWQLKAADGAQWSLAAWMCKLDGPTFISLFGNEVTERLGLRPGSGNIYTEG